MNKIIGINIVRMRPTYYRVCESAAQLAQRQRLQAVNSLLNPFPGLMKITFSAEKAGRTARSEAQSYILRNAMAGEYPDIYVDKSKALLSRGPLPVPADASVTALPEGLLTKWENHPETAVRYQKDPLVVMALQAESGQAAYRFTDTRRSDGRYVWTHALPSGTVDVWLAFRNPDQTEMSDSMYTGKTAV